MKFFVPLRPLLLGWLLALLVWVAVAFVVAFGLVANTPFSWIEAMQAPVREWLPWTLVAPPLFRLVARCPLERERRLRPLLVHAVAIVLVAGLAWGWARFLDIRPAPGFERFGGPVSERFPRFEPRPDFGTGEPDRSSGSGRERPSGAPPSRRPGFDPRGTAEDSGSVHAAGGIVRGEPNAFGRVLWRVLSTYLLLASVAHAALFYRRAKEREASLAHARLAALRMQLQPHFLFNTLNTISGLVHTEPERADAVLTALGELLRLTLETSGERELPLHRELRMVGAYLDIMHARFEDRIRFTLAIEPGAREALVPAFILQPLIENAVRHGLEPRPGGGSVTIGARREGERLAVEVHDDGVGLAEGGPLHEGVGLGNTRARLNELYGGRAKLELKSGGTGCTVVLSLPFHIAA